MIETLRTIPVQASLIVLNTLAMSPALSELPDFQEALTDPSAINLAPIAINGLLAVGKIRLRNRTERVFEEHGYDERFVKASSVSYCGRQATKIACERTDTLDDFNETINDPNYSKMLSWLPHV